MLDQLLVLDRAPSEKRDSTEEGYKRPAVHDRPEGRVLDAAVGDVAGVAELHQVLADEHQDDSRVRRVADVGVRSGGDEGVAFLDGDFVREELAHGLVRPEAY